MISKIAAYVEGQQAAWEAEAVRQIPGIFDIRSIAFYARNNEAARLPRMTGQPFFLKRWRAAWLVLTGAADALVW